MRFVYYGGSVEFFFVCLTFLLVLTAFGLWKNTFMWACVRGMEGWANLLGRTFAWAGRLMVLRQGVTALIQRIFARPAIPFGFGSPLLLDIRWWRGD